MAAEWLPTSLAERVGTYYFASVLLLVVVLVNSGPPRAADGVRPCCSACWRSRRFAARPGGASCSPPPWPGASRAGGRKPGQCRPRRPAPPARSRAAARATRRAPRGHAARRPHERADATRGGWSATPRSPTRASRGRSPSSWPAYPAASGSSTPSTGTATGLAPGPRRPHLRRRALWPLHAPDFPRLRPCARCPAGLGDRAGRLRGERRRHRLATAARLARALTTEGTWQPAYCDAQGGVFVRRDQTAGAPAPCPLP